LTKGVNVMNGYYKNPEATAEALDKDGWLHTGDLGIIDSDGFIYIKGRSKSLILGPSGQNIYPEEIQAKLNNMNYVQESVIVERDSKLLALVYPDYELADAKSKQEAEMKKLMEKNIVELNKTLPPYSQIAKIEIFSEEFQKTPTKKIKRYLYT